MAGKKALMMGNHGITVIGETVAEAFEDLYYLEKACKTMVLAHGLALETAQSWDQFSGAALAHFEQLKGHLENQGSSYQH